MSWSSGGLIFDGVADALIEADADEHTMRTCLGTLIDRLEECDWGTQYESWERYSDNPVIVAIFAEHGIPGDDDDE